MPFSVLRLCWTTLPNPIHTSTSAYTSTCDSNLLSEPLETLTDKCDFLEVYFGVSELATADKTLLERKLNLLIYTPTSSEGQDVSRNDFQVDQFGNCAPKGNPATPKSQRTIDSTLPEYEYSSMSFSSFSARSDFEAGFASKSGYLCSICNIPFPSSSNFHRHMREKHKKTRFVCDKCGKDFSRADYVKKHRCRGKTWSARARAVKPRMA